MARGWSLLTAIAFILLGMFAIAQPLVTGLGLAVLISWLLIIGGIAHAVSAFTARRDGASGVVWPLLVGVLYVIGGLYFLSYPLLGLGTLTLLLAIILLLEAVVWIALYVKTRTLGASPMLLANGIVTLLLGGMIWLRWPSSSVWAVGTLVGVNLLMTGFWRLMPSARPRALA
jgi:uncharacterized membrane protein HdeD (DUF308 family)